MVGEMGLKLEVTECRVIISDLLGLNHSFGGFGGKMLWSELFTGRSYSRTPCLPHWGVYQHLCIVSWYNRILGWFWVHMSRMFRLTSIPVKDGAWGSVVWVSVTRCLPLTAATKDLPAQWWAVLLIPTLKCSWYLDRHKNIISLNSTFVLFLSSITIGV